jgi:hypothetical protein
MLPFAREQQIELHGTPVAVAAVLLGEGDQGAPDAGAAVIGRRDTNLSPAARACIEFVRGEVAR